MPRTRKHHRKDSGFFEPLRIRLSQKERDVPILRTDHRHPVELLPLANVTAEQVDTGCVQQRRLVADPNACRDLGRGESLVKAVEDPPEGVNKRLAGVWLLYAVERCQLSQIAELVGDGCELDCVEAPQECADQFRGVGVQNPVFPAVKGQAGCLDGGVDEAEPALDAGDDPDAVIWRTVENEPAT